MTAVVQIAGGILLAFVIIAGAVAVLRNWQSIGALAALALVVVIVMLAAGVS